ncbi:glycosyltransferase family 4 protein [Nocardioides ginsengisoli]|uniref:Glycosyltransferase family 4 protein n=1 Tax=Nocardioides ginsengisoli TaxID=363868 RepID=A0ABW3W7N0_9ACTN
MRVLHLVKTGVGAVWAQRQIEVLHRMGVDVHVALPDGPRAADYRASGIAVHPTSPGLVPTRPSTWPVAVRTVRELVDRIRPDLVHSHFVDTTLAMRAALWASGPPRVFQVPGPLHLERAPTRWIELATATDRDHWIASCGWVRERYLRSGLPERRVHLSHYGTDTARFAVAGGAGSLRAELGLAPSTALIAMVAHFYAPKRYLGQTRGIKGHEDLIHAAARLVGAGHDLHVVFAGGPWDGADTYAVEVRALAAAVLPGRHTFLGLRDDIPAIYASADLAVHPSASENLGGAAESLLAGVPTVATRVGGFPDVVRPGRTGWLAAPRDPVSLAAAIGDALADRERAARYAAAGQVLARELLDVDRTAGEVAAIYDRIMARQLPRPPRSPRTS